MKKKFPTMFAGKGGWCEWVYPVGNFQFKCCDCGLVHEMQFKAFVEKQFPVKRGKSGRFEVIELPNPVRAMFRARRKK